MRSWKIVSIALFMIFFVGMFFLPIKMVMVVGIASAIIYILNESNGNEKVS